ncbi:hypothetical protein AAVH_02043 [Aphelenchoides avenae]|nr:hypothetical protein AAVH_02038 [Aphelenchus avenae]KAH7730994.1 hypothetical protein AAVH_02043 [Aphelenchus avenae]
MPLPPALLERLKKRGIVQEKRDGDEEVFAESYDDREEDEEETDGSKYRGGAPGCPNKWNHYHVCTDFCFDHWQEGYPEHRLPERYLEQRKDMLKRFPLPQGWKEVYDAGVRRHYYWCPATDEVCWVSPRHPKAVISEAAPKVAKEMSDGTKRAVQLDTSDDAPSKRFGDRRRDDRGRRGRDDREGRYRGPGDRERRDRRRARSDSEGEAGSGGEEEIELSERDKLKRAKRKGIDPMDPAAYGDAPVGNWASGLTSDAKTGADVTANGPLFQQRPYPAPGAILRKQNPDMYKD